MAASHEFRVCKFNKMYVEPPMSYIPMCSMCDVSIFRLCHVSILGLCPVMILVCVM